MNLARHVTCGATCTQSYKKLVNTCYAGCSAHIPSASSRLHSRSVLPWLPSIRGPISDCSTSGTARSQVVARSFLGVGAPEALLVGVVALVVFGP
ncbi:Sec-independent protein translocase protein TatA/B/E, partial [Haematococcus lacustris]